MSAYVCDKCFSFLHSLLPRHSTQSRVGVWVMAVSGGEPRRLGVGASPALAPAGDLVAFVQRGQIWTAGITGTQRRGDELAHREPAPDDDQFLSTYFDPL